MGFHSAENYSTCWTLLAQFRQNPESQYIEVFLGLKQEAEFETSVYVGRKQREICMKNGENAFKKSLHFFTR